MLKTKFEVIKPEGLTENPFRLFDRDWMLIAAGTRKAFNMMTASWGGLGILWNKRIAIAFVRPTRHTYEFIEKTDTFTCSFFAEKYRDALNLCGSVSGRDVNKVTATGLIPEFATNGAVYFKQARLVLICRKVYFQDLDPEHFLDAKTLKLYPEKDFHRMYFGEIVRCLSRRAGG